MFAMLLFNVLIHLSHEPPPTQSSPKMSVSEEPNTVMSTTAESAHRRIARARIRYVLDST